MAEFNIFTIRNNIVEEQRIERENNRMIFIFVAIFVSILLIVQILRSFVFFSVVVSGSSMSDTLNDSELLVVNRLKEPDRYDVIVFDANGVDGRVDSDGVLYIKRVIAFGGEEIWTENGEIFILKEGSDEPMKLNDKNAYFLYPEYKLNIERTTVPEGCYYVLGDNRYVSRDSRSIGSVPKGKVMGVVSDFVIDNKNNDFWKFFFGMV